MNTKKMNTKSKKSKGIIGITLAAIMIASIFAVIAPTTVANHNPPIPPETEVNSSIRIYGDVQPQGNAPERYEAWTDPFDSTIIPKDSIMFNPAMLDTDFGVVVNGENAREKMFLRAWYEPCGNYWGDRKNYTRPTINLEYTYMLISTNWMPTHGGAGSLIAFPTCEIDAQTGLGAWDCAPGKSVDTNLTKLSKVSGDVEPYGKTVDGTIELEKAFSLSAGDKVQFLDHKLEVTTITADGDYVIKVWYAGNAEDDAGKGWILMGDGERKYFDRHNNEYDGPNHNPAIDLIRTWYVRRDGGNIILGMELQRSDVFYVDGVRYDVTAIEVLDTTGNDEADEFKYITLRTKLPKCVDTVRDESVVSSQCIDCIEPAEIIPVLPPFNEKHIMVDDIDIPLWEPTDNEGEWPYGDPDGIICLCTDKPEDATYFPHGERYLTMQNNSDPCFQRWLDYFDDTDARHEDMMIDTDNDMSSIGIDGWIAYDVSERVIEGVNATEVFYIAEDVEQRYSTDLLEKLHETLSGSANGNGAEKIDLFFLVDGSGSISAADFTLQKKGLAYAINDSSVIPQDGSVSVCVIQFSGIATVEVALTTITNPTVADSVSAAIMAISQMGGMTNMGGAFDVAVANFPSDPSGRQIIDLSTDGVPTAGELNPIPARDRALAAGFDEVNTLGVGTGIDETLLRNLCHPPPSTTAPGFYVYATDYNDFVDEIRAKIRKEIGGELEESWTKFDIQTLPDQYTEFVLPELPDYYTIDEGVDWQVELDGDYLITTSLIAPTATGRIPGWDRNFTRVAFSYDQKEGMDGIDIYVNYNETNDVNTVRIYGHCNISTGGDRNDCWIEMYEHWEEPFNPTVIRKDSITFDAAILRYSEEYSMHAQGEDCDLKEYFRAWYVPEFKFYGEHHEGDIEPAIVTETTYMLIDSQDKKPWHADANRSWFAFPIVADLSNEQIGLDTFENDGVASAMDNLVMLSLVDCNPDDLESPLYKTTNGTIRIEKTYIMEPGDTVQFIEHKLTFNGYDISGDNPLADVWYCGNTLASNQESLKHNVTILNRTRFFDRHNGQHDAVRHPDRTWYARFNEPPLIDGTARITVGKELQRGDIFYVDGVRYEIPAIEVLDWDGNLTNGCEKFKYITIRSPFPKYLGGDEEKIDEYQITSQYIVKIKECNSIPVLPPLNMDHEIVDDTDVVLWQPLKLLHKWPYGDIGSGRPGIEYFPCAERYLTMQYPPYAWLKYFRAVPIDTDRDMETTIPSDWQLWENYEGPFYPGNVTAEMPDGWQCCKCGIPMPLPDKWTEFDNEHWIANDVDERIIAVDPLDFCWKSEDIEPRYSTNLLQILNETLYDDKVVDEDWTKYDIQTLPDEYTEFKLPEIPSIDPEVYIGAEYQYWVKINELSNVVNPGSYLITTSFIAPNAKGDLNLEQSYSTTDRFAFTYNARDGTGIYVNEDPVIPISPYGEKFTMHLDEGDNYVSLPVMPEDTNPAAIFGPDVNVWSYDTTTGWEPTSAVEEGVGYYVYSPKPKTVTIYGTGVSLDWSDIAATLETGWNLIGPGNESISMVDVTGVIVMRYDRITDTFVMIPPAMGEELKPGEGYWVLK